MIPETDVRLPIDSYWPTGIFGLTLLTWSMFFVKWLKRCERYWATKFNTEHVKKELRPEFYGDLILSPVTGKMELSYSEWRRLPAYIIGFFVTNAMLYVAFVYCVFSFNLQGYMNPAKEGSTIWKFLPGVSFFLPQFILDHIADMHVTGYMPTIAPHGMEGAMFDVNSDFMSFVPIAGHSLFMNIWNLVFQSVAEKLTRLENHKYQEDFKNAMIFKRYLFEFVDGFFPLWFLAFYRMDMNMLKEELIGLYMIDWIRRFGAETGLSWLFMVKAGSTGNDYSDGYTEEEIFSKSQVDSSEDMAFDDYLEFVLMQGFIIMFAFSMPLAAILSLLSIALEIRSDSYRITYLVRRPRANKIAGLGIWTPIIESMTWISIFTNVWLFFYGSGQAKQWWPAMFDTSRPSLGYEPSRVTRGNGRWIVFYMMLMEHVFVGLFTLIKMYVADTPRESEIENQRRAYQRRNKIKLL